MRQPCILRRGSQGARSAWSAWSARAWKEEALLGVRIYGALGLVEGALAEDDAVRPECWRVIVLCGFLLVLVWSKGGFMGFSQHADHADLHTPEEACEMREPAFSQIFFVALT